MMRCPERRLSELIALASASDIRVLFRHSGALLVLHFIEAKTSAGHAATRLRLTCALSPLQPNRSLIAMDDKREYDEPRACRNLGRIMNFRSLFYPFITGTFIVCGSLNEAPAQTATAPIKSNQSSGVTVTISKVAVQQRKIILQFVATNNTQARVYIRDAHFEQSQKAFLGSGEQLNWPTTVAIETCDGPVTQCLQPPNVNDLNRFSYMEPGDFTALGLTYEANSAVNESDTISFSVVVIARFATPNGDPAQAGPPKVIRFNFPYVPLSGH
jgi:hypothetical protein